MLIVDAQVHIWNPSTPERPWPQGLKPQRAEPLGMDELLQQMNTAGVDRAERMFWGSDLSRLRGPYRECVTMFTEEMPWLSARDLEWIMGRGICEWVEWKSGAL